MIPSFPPAGGAPSPSALLVSQAVVSGALLDARVGTILAARVGPDVDGAPRWIAVAGNLVPLSPGAGLAAGTEVRVRVVAREPALLLAVLPKGAAGEEPSHGATRGDASSGALRTSTDAQLSSPGRALHNLVARILAAAAPVEGRSADSAAAAGGPSSATPLLAAGEADAPSLAHALHRAISMSGLFYESHQAQWVAGSRTIESVRAEPQGRLPPLPPRGERAAESAPAVRDSGTAAVSAAAYAAPETMAGAGVEEAVHPVAVTLVQQQLAVLDGRQIVWQGLLWPDTPARVEIEEDHAARATGEENAWTSRLHVELPRLGPVDATLSLAAGGLRIVLSAPAAEGADRMRARLHELGEQLQAAGLTVARLTVERDG